jgi:hypothetical protein
LASTWDRAFEEHMPYEIEYRLVLTSGEVRHNHEIARPEFDESGGYLGHFGTTQDITDRIQAEDALREVRDELELRVKERTRDIEETNETLNREITERKRAENSLIETNRALKTLSGCNEALLRATTESELLNEICRIIVEVGGYRFAWVGAAEDDAAKTVRPLARFGYEKGYLETRPIIWADNDRGQGPTGIAIRSGKPSVEGNILESSSLAPWHAAMVERRYAAIAVLPLLADAKAYAALNIYASEPDAFDRIEVRLLTELANNLSYGIMALRGGAQVGAEGARRKRTRPAGTHRRSRGGATKTRTAGRRLGSFRR